MKYFILITHKTALKNNLDKAALELLMEHNRTLIESCDLQWFMNKIDKAVESLNAKFSRCKPLRSDWWQPGFTDLPKQDWILNGIGSCTFTLHATKD